MSLDAQAELQASKRAALEQLRFRKFKKQRTTLQTATFASSLSSLDPSQPPAAAPPLQSRDGTVPSRYFPTSAPTATTLVSSPSPEQPAPIRVAQEFDLRNAGPEAAAIPRPKPWGLFGRTGDHDPLSAPSGFMSPNGVPDASFSSPWGSSFNVHGSSELTSPSKPSLSHLRSPDPIDLFNSDSPDSPAVQRVGQRRRLVNSLTTISNSSEESLPEVHRAFQTNSKPRIMRGHRPESREASPASTPQSQGRHLDSLEPSPSSTPLSEAEDPKFTRFKMTMPQHSPILIRAAWKQAGGDEKQATVLLLQPNWRPNSSASAGAGQATEVTGRVKELDEATRAMKAAAKEKGKKSMIYANRVSTAAPASPSSPSTSKVTIDLTDTPSSPAAPRARKRIMRAVHSDSEPESVACDVDSDVPEGEQNERRALNFFNTKDAEALQEMTGCTPEQAAVIIDMRPFGSVDELKSRLGQGKKKAGPSGISPRIFEDCAVIFEGYSTVDRILEDCEEIGSTIRAAIAGWVAKPAAGDQASSAFEDGALTLVSPSPQKQPKSRDRLEAQPSLLAQGVQLKEYQLLGINWLHLLYGRRLSCILADEMGLGKTIQVISFFALLKERGNHGPHLVVVPSSTLENWCREFARFAPTISFQTYYAGKEERPQMRHQLLNGRRATSAHGQGWEVLITTYALAQGDGQDRKFFRSIEWDTCVFDEGHVLKNFQSQRYQALLKFPSKWRLLLTGTPLQNNLHELVSLMNFILPSQFADSLASLWAIFKVKGDAKVALLAEERVSRAKKMMTPFVLRRRKDQVLKDLPKKTERIEWCEMTSLQSTLYGNALQRSRKVVVDVDSSEPSSESAPCGAVRNVKSKATKKTRDQKSKDKKYLENSTNVLMDLRKAALHPMLFRTRFTDQILTRLARELLKEPDFKKREAIFELVKEDMEVMTDAELQNFCATYKCSRKFLQDEKCYLDAGKITTLLRLLKEYGEEKRKVLIFSQFTQVLDILEAVLARKSIKYLVLTGSTPVDVRQALVDEFTEDDSISVFLLSTKAGGMGINLTAASVVIMFDQDFNPHNDRQAQDRAYRIGQKREVEVIKLIMRGTIEEDMLKLGETKLALDEAVAGDSEEVEGGAREAEVRQSLMNALRDKLFLEDKSELVAADGERPPT